MPNDVTTRCTIIGPAADVRRFWATMIRVPEGECEVKLDFDNIIPMPAVIKETSGLVDLDLGIEILTGKSRPCIYENSFLDQPRIQELGIKTIAELRNWAEKNRPGAIEAGGKALAAHCQTGFYDWYDWSIAKWGTKWNSYSLGLDDREDGKISFRFDTAWSFPTPIFEKLAELFPALRFECACFDELWNFAGRGVFNGDPPFEFVEATDELFAAVYGFEPEHDDEPIETAVVTD